MTRRSKICFIGLVFCFWLPSLSEAEALGPGGRAVGADWSRSVVYARHGMAATAHPLASQVAIDVLQAGGSAVDAAIAANALLGFVEPTGNGMGGDLFAIVWDPVTETLSGYNGSGRSPMRRDLASLQAQIAALKARGQLAEDYQGIPSHGSLPVTVPGAVDGWFALHERFGRLPMSDILAPTVGYARVGVPVAPIIAKAFANNMARFEQVAPMIEEFDNARHLYFSEGRAPLAGEIFRNPDLAHTLELIALQGRDAFYRGQIAEVIGQYMTRIGGDLSRADLAAHHGEWVTPRSTDYHGIELFELPPNGQGFAALIMLNILKQWDLRDYERGDPEVFHLMVEAKRLAFSVMAQTFADPDFAQIPIDTLLSEAFAKQLAGRIQMDRVLPADVLVEPLLEGEGDTTYLTVADGNGMMVSLIQSNYRGMGSGLVPDGLGFMLQDRGELFSLDPQHPNAYEPGKRPFHTIIPAFAMRDGQPWMSFGLMGGGMQPQGHVQVIVNLVDFNMTLQEAGDAARFLHDGGASPDGGSPESIGTLYLEPGVPVATAEALSALGHRVKINSDGSIFGGYQAIARDPETGVLSGATEMRKDGTVAAW
jgi:gamma-glutamyltranspeptidase/glutathione hydrolase